ncbi:MAG: molecular chaperone HscB [Lentimonas sp.]|jgi:molecular chaperone HscB
MHLDRLNHFEKLGFQVQFEIDEEELENSYLALQHQFHPDIVKDETEGQINSILINEAYKILAKPIKRAIYLMQINGINIDDEECKIKPSQENLIFVMEIREEILDSQKDQLKIAEIRKNIKKIINDEMKIIADLFAKDNFSEIAQKLIKVKYLDKTLLDLKSF